MQIHYVDGLVIGGGLAGLRTAIGLKRRGHNVVVLSLVPPKRSHSAAAQGGMQASLGNCSMGRGDNEDIHFRDTVRGSDWGADQEVVRMFVHTAPKAVRELAAWGVPWNRVAQGGHIRIINGEPVTVTDSVAAHGLITARNFGGTQKWRTCYVADGTGHSMLYTMSNQAIAEQIPVHERCEALSLIYADGRCYGAVVRNLINGQISAYVARATCIATGGAGRIYRLSTNAVINEGIGAAIALETGIAQLGNMEAIQFHPTGIFPAGILVTEGCRGDGGLLLDAKLHRFMPDYEPDKKELASRDVVSRCMEQHILSGQGVKSPFGEHLWLDIRLLGETHINSRLREVKEICQYFLGIDPAKQLIPVRPAQHYSMGGVRTNVHGQSPHLAGLFSVGEAACWDLHGFNRLGGNSVAETVVAGMIVGETMSDFIDSEAGAIAISTQLVSDSLKRETDKLARIAYGEGKGKGKQNPFAIIREMQETLSNSVGIFRQREPLLEAVEKLKTLLHAANDIHISSANKGANSELVAAYRAPKMLKLALCVAKGALQREESRGAHYREDFPVRNDAQWLNRTLARWLEGDEEPTLSYENLDINNMEYPPGWRGYGAKNWLSHPEAQARQAQVDAITASGSNRYDVQNTLMPYKQLLPESLRGVNSRLDSDDSDSNSYSKFNQK